MLNQLLEKETGKTTDQLDVIAGKRGGFYISAAGTASYTGAIKGFVSWDDATVIYVLTIKGEDGLGATYTGLTAIPIPKGMLITWGESASKITISAGAGWLIKG